MDGWVQFLVIGAIILIQIIVRAARKGQQGDEQPETPARQDPMADAPEWAEPSYDDDHDEWWAEAEKQDPSPAPVADEVSPLSDPLAPRREALLARLDGLMQEARELATTARLDHATRDIGKVLDDDVAPEAFALRQRHAGGGSEEMLRAGERAEDALQRRFAAIETFILQRRQPGRREELAAADALATACYAPLIELARARGLALTSTTPVTVQGRFDQELWSSFIPTVIAPLFLPGDFFVTLARWPTVARETGRDFLAATGDASSELRRQLGVPEKDFGTRPLSLDHQGLSAHDLRRIFGAWFDELYCDVFGTLMLGPAYGYALARTLASPARPRLIAQVGVDPSGHRYDVVPPRHLRVVVATQVLDLVGEGDAAAEIRQEWAAQHPDVETMALPVTGMALEVPLWAFEEPAADIATRLCREPVAAFGNSALGDLHGLGWSGQIGAEARRARDELAGGRTTSASARTVVAGAVMAWWQDPDADAALLQLARESIVGVSVRRPDAYARPDRAVAFVAPDEGGRDDVREAFILHTLLAAPPVVARMRGGAPAFLARRSWPR